MSNGNSRIGNALKWSFTTEIIVKVISPITNMILARILMPEVFGIVASLTMITTFADMFTDAGFQKYIIQHQFKSEEEQSKYISVAFFSNIFISTIIYLLILVMANRIAELTGISGYENAIRIYSLVLILTSFSSVQFAIYRKKLQYKKMGIIRIITKTIPLFITVPLALLGIGFWSLIIGNMVGNFIQALIFMLWTDEKIHLFFSFQYLKNMLSFCGGALLETISAWLIANIGIFVIGQYLGSYYLGIYKTSLTTVNQIVSVVTSSTMNILLATLSENQANSDKFRKTVESYQYNLGFFTIPLGIGVFVFRNLVTQILLGSNWDDATLLIGLCGMITCISVIYADIGSLVVIAKGKPNYIFISNMIQVLLQTIALFICRNRSFETIVVVTCTCRIQLTITHYIFACKFGKISFWGTFPIILCFSISSIIMGICGYIFCHIISSTLLQAIVGIPACIMIYFSLIYCIPMTRSMLKNNIEKIKDRLHIRKNDENKNT